MTWFELPLGWALPLVLLCLAGCSSAPSTGAESAGRLSFVEAQQRCKQLRKGMSQNEVRRLLGDPGETNERMFGRRTASPWLGKEWVYKWRFEGEERELDVVFQRVGDFWMLNHWGWV